MPVHLIGHPRTPAEWRTDMPLRDSRLGQFPGLRMDDAANPSIGSAIPRSLLALTELVVRSIEEAEISSEQLAAGSFPGSLLVRCRIRYNDGYS